MRGRIPTGCANPCTTLEFERVTNEASPGLIHIQWYLATFTSGVAVQRGETTVDATTKNVTVTTVGSTAQAFTLFSSTPVVGDTTWDGNDPMIVELTTATNLQIRTNVAASHIVAWQVVQWTNAAEINVQKGSLTTSTTPTTLMGTTSSSTVTLPTSYSFKKTFALVSYRATPTNSAQLGAYTPYAYLNDAACPTTTTGCPVTGSTQLIIARNAAGSPNETITEIFYEVIELKDNSSVQNHVADGTAGKNTISNLTTTPNLEWEMDRSRSIAFSTGQYGFGQSGGGTAYVTDDLIGVVSATFVLNQGPTLTMTRDNSGSLTNGLFGWEAVQFDRGTGYGVKVGSFTKNQWAHSNGDQIAQRVAAGS